MTNTTGSGNFVLEFYKLAHSLFLTEQLYFLNVSLSVSYYNKTLPDKDITKQNIRQKNWLNKNCISLKKRQ